jgi:chromosome partitioning protein
MIIVVGGIKGGAGKSTIAANLAVRRATEHNVLLVDGDDQETTALWAATRSANFPEKSHNLTCIQIRGRAARDEVLKLSTHYQDTIVDVGGRDTTTQRAALTIANLVLVPLPPRSPDIWTLEKVVELLEEVRTVNPSLTAWVFLNRADASGTDNQAAMQIITDTPGIDLIPPKIGDRKAFPNAHTQGLSVIEVKPNDPKAIVELEELYQYCFSTNMILNQN